MIKKEYEITGEEGLHARPSSILVGALTSFTSEITLEHDGKEVNLKSILGVMSLGVSAGSTVKIPANGEDENEAIAKVDEVMKSEGIGNSI